MCQSGQMQKLSPRGSNKVHCYNSHPVKVHRPFYLSVRNLFYVDFKGPYIRTWKSGRWMPLRSWRTSWQAVNGGIVVSTCNGKEHVLVKWGLVYQLEEQNKGNSEW